MEQGVEGGARSAFPAAVLFPAMVAAPKVSKSSDWREALDGYRAFAQMNVGVLHSTLQALARQDQWHWCLEILKDAKEQRPESKTEATKTTASILASVGVSV